MYSIFLPFAAIVIDLCVAYIYFKVYDHQYVQCLLLGGIFTTSLLISLNLTKHLIYQHDWWVGGITTSLIALVPLLIIATFLSCGWSRLKQVISQ